MDGEERYDRSKLRYPSDLIEPLIPPAKRGGNRRHVEVREVMNGIMYILSTGCQWRAIPIVSARSASAAAIGKRETMQAPQDLAAPQAAE